MTPPSALTTEVKPRVGHAALVGLLSLNVVVAAMLVAVRTIWWRWLLIESIVPINPNNILMGQIVAGSLVAALVPRRSIFGLAWASVIGLTWGLVGFAPILIQHQQPLALAGMIWNSLSFSLGVLMFAQGLRFGLRWRVVAAEEAAHAPPPPLGIGDLLEWTLSISAWFALVRLVETSLEDTGWGLEWLARAVLITVPMALAVTSRRGLTLGRAAAIVAWAATVELAAVAIYTWASPSAFNNHPWWFYGAIISQETAGLLLATGLNFAVLGRLGYRWQRPLERIASPAAAQTSPAGG